MAIASFSAPATPCGTFVVRATKTVPSLVAEQTLILFDPQLELEHFVRERVGSFTAFVLAASDAKALAKWFSDNQLRIPPEAEAWLAHYVTLRFYFAALRYEMQEEDLKRTSARAETVRISFKTPLPFYPYREPVHATASDLPRDLAVWLVSTQAYTPVSLFESVSASQSTVSTWKRPFLEHASQPTAREELASALSDELSKLLPSNVGRAGKDPGPLWLQVFEDQKRSRAGFGDIVMVPQRPTPLTGAALARSRKLMASLDPAVTP